MQVLKMTSKRQVTFSVKVCEELGLTAGDSLLLERTEREGKKVWMIRPRGQRRELWFSALRKYAAGKSHDMRSIRESIGEAVREKRR